MNLVCIPVFMYFGERIDCIDWFLSDDTYDTVVEAWAAAKQIATTLNFDLTNGSNKSNDS